MSREILNCEILDFVAKKLDNNVPKCGEKCNKDACPYVSNDLFFPKANIEAIHDDEIEVDWIKFLESGGRY